MLFAKGECALEEERETRARETEEERTERAAAKVTIAYEAWEQYIDQMAGLAPTFNYQEYLREHPYVRPARTRQMFRRALNSEWPVNAHARRSSMTEVAGPQQRALLHVCQGREA